MLEFSLKLLFNLTVTLIITRLIYYRATKNSDYFFTYLIIGQVIFLLCYLLKNIELELGFVLGLFAIFGIIRYRTGAIKIKEMTYLFSIIGLSMINALSSTNFYKELIVSNSIVVLLIWVLEFLFQFKNITSTLVTVTNSNKLELTNKHSLVNELESRLQFKIEKAEVKKINYFNDTAEILIYYIPDK